MNMKSIVEEGSSIAKAIEKGWIRAGKPQEFKVKIFEDPQKNIFGFTTKPAKIALFFSQDTSSTPVAEPKEKRQTQTQRTEKKHQQQPMASTTPASSVQKSARQPHEHEGQKQTKRRASWAPEMVQSVADWMKNLLALINQSNNLPTFETSNNYLKINFAHPVTQNPLKERLLFKSFAHLIMSSMRNIFKQELRDLKIIITSGDSRDAQS